ncbi:MAG: hypothetical protein K2L94_02440 [Alphaproteobacteria bacterium]|nr:hypothetical protein [Alphaproteobacteria bacterium]
MVVFIPGMGYASTDLDASIERVRMVCGGISDDLSHMKTMAGINTAVTGVGTAAGGVALGTGIAKIQVDKRADVLEAELAAEIDLLNNLGSRQDIDALSAIPDFDIFALVADNAAPDDKVDARNSISEKEQELEKLTQKSERLGNWRTGMMATNTATNIAGAVIAGTNKVGGDLKSRIAECVVAVNHLSNVRMQARISNTATDSELMHAENIVDACVPWATVDVSAINSKSTGATVSSGIGAGLGLAGTIVSAAANSGKVRNDNTVSGKQKEKDLNTASNVLAGGTTVATGVAVVFNATQIGVIKRAVAVADNCEQALR